MGEMSLIPAALEKRFKLTQGEQILWSVQPDPHVFATSHLKPVIVVSVISTIFIGVLLGPVIAFLAWLGNYGMVPYTGLILLPLLAIPLFYFLLRRQAKHVIYAITNKRVLATEPSDYHYPFAYVWLDIGDVQNVQVKPEKDSCGTLVFKSKSAQVNKVLNQPYATANDERTTSVSEIGFQAIPNISKNLAMLPSDTRRLCKTD